jgi:hypothetical protein
VSGKDYSHVPDWCRPGAEVAEIGHEAGVLRIVITKVHKRFVIGTQPGSDHERKYRIEPSRIQAVRNSTWDPARWLAPMTDPAVRDRLAGLRRKRLAGEVERLALEWRRDGDVDAARRIAERLKDAGIIASYELPGGES